ADSATPVQVAALGNQVNLISVGSFHTCATKIDGTLWCWGSNAFGALGDGTTTDSPTPVPISALGSGVRLVTAGPHGTCAEKADGRLWCWGDGFPTPIQVPANYTLPTPPVAVPAGGRRATVALALLLLASGAVGLRRGARKRGLFLRLWRTLSSAF